MEKNNENSSNVIIVDKVWIGSDGAAIWNVWNETITKKLPQVYRVSTETC